ncbi:MAG: hypothetical protein GY814_00765 [Gammaproteobacteria bacterium]|nr:hypothetical protein [Gammaproteobacteria bacterium]
MKIMTSKEREAQKQPPAPESYQHPKPIPGHVYMVTRSKIDRLVGAKYHAVMDNTVGDVRLYRLGEGVVWCTASTFGVSNNHYQWKDINDQVYLNTDDLED